jgi:DNA-directed RNA polymerase specialized sigma24 family protein
LGFDFEVGNSEAELQHGLGPLLAMYFPTTQWSLLAQASLSGETSARQALEELCRRYWAPLHQFIRARGYTDAEAQDLTQEFILHLIEHSTLQKADRLRGRFRSFLLGALVRFLADQYDRRRAQKRGSGALHLELQVAENDLAASSNHDTSFFDREWALAILENSLRTVQSEFEPKLGPARFATLRAFLPGSVSAPTYDEAAEKLQLTVPALKSELHRLRQRFKSLVRQEVANTVSAPHEIDEEMTHLQQVLMNRGHDFETGLQPPRRIS